MCLEAAQTGCGEMSVPMVSLGRAVFDRKGNNMLL